MKKLFIFALALSLACTYQAQAQDNPQEKPKEKKSFWDKVDNATNKVLGLPTDQKCTTAGYETAIIRSFSKEVDFILESCINDGKTLILSFYLNNRGKELDISGFSDWVNSFSDPNYTGKKKDETKFIDDLGNEYEVCYNAVGKSIRPNRVGVDFLLPEGVKVKGEIRVAKFNNRAKTLQLVNIVGNIRTVQNGMNKYQPFNIILKNVPVYTPAQILSQSKELFKKDMPAVEAQTEKNCVVKSVTITEENTQVAFTYTNTRDYSNTVYHEGGTFITANGKEYQLTAYYYIAGNRDLAINNYGINGGATADFTLVFEKIPETTNVFNITWNDWKWNNVWLVEPPKPEQKPVPQPEPKPDPKPDVEIINNTPTTSVIGLDDDWAKLYSKRKRINDTERKYLRIDDLIIYPIYINKYKNEDLSKGKVIYSGANGRLETIIKICTIEEDAIEYLISYNAKGEYVDCVLVGQIYPYAGYRSSSKIDLKTITVTSVQQGGKRTITKYNITDNLKFVEVK